MADLQSLAWHQIDFLAWTRGRDGHYLLCLKTNEGLKDFNLQRSRESGRTGYCCDLCHASNSEVGLKAEFVAVARPSERKVGL